MPKSIFE